MVRGHLTWADVGHILEIAGVILVLGGAIGLGVFMFLFGRRWGNDRAG